MSYNIAVVGATGAVGAEMLKILEQRSFPVKGIKLLASSRSEGKELKFQNVDFKVQELDENSFEDVDIALFSAGSERSRELATVAAGAGAVVVDNSSAFRMESDVPLIVPEINAYAVAGYKERGIIANPNCTTIITLMALKPIHDAVKIKRVVATSYQSVSGAGAQAMEELKLQTLAWAEGKPMEPVVFPFQIAFNVIPQVDSFLENGYTKEEMKLHHESRKILNDSTIQVTATTVRVPVFRSHCICVNVETERKISTAQAREAFEAFPGIDVVDEPHVPRYPLPIDAEGKDNCMVGRIREDYTVSNGLSFWVVGDQLRKGAALNAVQIAELLIKHYI